MNPRRSLSGTMSVVAESGALRPVTASGAWGPTGATLDARILLEASSLTTPYAAKAGPEAIVRLRGRHIQGDLFQVTGSAVASRAFARSSPRRTRSSRAR